MIFACGAIGCVRGIVHRPGRWSDPCTFCGGLGGITFAELCRRLNEHPSTVERIVRSDRPMRPKTASRILDKLLELTR